MRVSNRISQLAQGGTLTLLLATVLVVPLLFSPNVWAWRSVKPIVFEMMVLGLVGLALLQAAPPGALWSRRRIAEFLGTGANLPVLLLVLWGAVSWARSPAPDFSRVEWIRLACGAGLYFVVGAMLQRREQVKTLVDVLMGVAVLTSLFGFVAYGQPDSSSMSSTFGNRQLFAGFLLMLVPLLLVLSFSDLEPKRKIAAQVAAVLCVSSLLLAQTRSSWLGAIVATVVLGAMALRQVGPGSSLARRKHQIVLPLIIVVGALSLFLMLSRTAPVLSARASTFGSAAHDLSVGWRLHRWSVAGQLVRQHPLTGTGIGTYPLEQARRVKDSMPLALMQRSGPSLNEQAHNEYLQMAVELGVVGVALHLWVLGAFFLYGLRALRSREPSFRKLVLMGCLAAIAGQAVDALSNPAWRFADVGMMFWLMLGLGTATATAALRSPRRASAEGRVPAPAAVASGFWWLGWQGATLGLTLVGLGSSLTWAQGPRVAAVYEPPIEVALVPSSAVLRPGECVEFRLVARTSPTGNFVDVTDQAQFSSEIDNPATKFCAVNNTPPTASQAAAGQSSTENLFCVPARACTSPGCLAPRTHTVVASFQQRADAQVRATITVSCP